MADFVVNCNQCGQPIKFQKFVNAQGQLKNRPVNTDGSQHVCVGNPAIQQSAQPLGIKLAAPVSETQSTDWDKRITEANSVALQTAMQFAQLGQQYGELEASLAGRVAALKASFEKLESTWADQLKSVQHIMVQTPTHEWQSTKRLHCQIEELYEEVIINQGIIIPFLIGEPGSMKTSVVDALANMLGGEEFPRFVVSANNQMSRAELLGFMNGYGQFVDTAIYNVVKHGGLLIVDEIDAGNANVLIALNTAATNSFVGFPNGELVRKHEKCYIIAAGNTVGTGGTEEFIGRNQLDMATRTRFAFIEWKTDWDLIAEIVRETCGSDEWAKKTKLMHDIVQRREVKFVVSSRVALAGARYIAAGKPESLIWERFLRKNISEDEWETVMADYDRAIESVGLKKPEVVDMSEFNIDELKLLSKAVGFGPETLVKQIKTLRPLWSDYKAEVLATTVLNAGVTGVKA